MQCCYTGGQLSSYLRMRYPDVIAGAISSSPTSFGCPGLGLVCKLHLTHVPQIVNTVMQHSYIAWSYFCEFL